MAKYYITGVWKDKNDVITHYAFHTILNNIVSNKSKISKDEAISLLINKSNSAQTLIWDNKYSTWDVGNDVIVVDGKYLRSSHNNRIIDNLGQLINYS